MARGAYFAYLQEKYFSGEHLVKIGYADDIEKEMKLLQSYNPYKIVIYKIMPSISYADYLIILECYKDRKKSSDWFTMTLEEVDRLCVLVRDKVNLSLNLIAEGMTETMNLDNNIYFLTTTKKCANFQHWIYESWCANPQQTKDQWCNKEIRQAIDSRIAEIQAVSNWKKMPDKERAYYECKFFYENYCLPNADGKVGWLMGTLQNQYESAKHLVEVKHEQIKGPILKSYINKLVSPRLWLHDQWISNPIATKEKWCNQEELRAIEKHINTGPASKKEGKAKSFAEFKFFYKTFCTLDHGKRGAELDAKINAAWIDDYFASQFLL